MAYTNCEQIRKAFIEKGWSDDTSFEELTLEDVKEKGHLFAINGILKGRKYFKMNVTGNIFDDKGKIALYNVRTTSAEGA